MALPILADPPPPPPPSPDPQDGPGSAIWIIVHGLTVVSVLAVGLVALAAPAALSRDQQDAIKKELDEIQREVDGWSSR